eukprot:14008599-Alexandrium_andersonii.AAC.1
MAPIGTGARARKLRLAPRPAAPGLPFRGAPSLLPAPFGVPRTAAYPSGRRARKCRRLTGWVGSAVRRHGLRS